MTDTSVISVLVGGLTAIVIGALAAIPPTLTAWATYKQSVKNEEAAVAQRVTTNDKLDSLTTKAQDIHNLTNGTNQNLTKSLQDANAKIETLNILVASLQGKLDTTRRAKRRATKPPRKS